MKIRARVGRWLRDLADRIDYHGAPRAIGHSFTFEGMEGIHFRDDGRGCPLWYLGESSYQRAHDEADTQHVQVDWRTMTTHVVGGALRRGGLGE